MPPVQSGPVLTKVASYTSGDSSEQGETTPIRPTCTSPVDLELLKAINIQDGNEAPTALLAHVKLGIDGRHNPVEHTCRV